MDDARKILQDDGLNRLMNLIADVEQLKALEIPVGGGAIAVPHNILSVTHSDSTAAAAVRGDIITAQGVGASWERLAASAPAATYRNLLGFDNGDTEPGYKAIFDATAAETLTVASISATGSAVVSARRDHTHAITSSSTPGAAASLLATNASGQLTLTGQLEVDHIQFDLTPIVSTPAEGRFYWNTDDGTLNLGMPGGNVNYQLGQEGLIRVKNETGVKILNGQLVYISGATGNRSLVSLAKADAESTSAPTLGMATEDIDHNHTGYVATWGYVRDLNTIAYAPKTVLYLSASTSGAYTDAKTTAPNHLVVIGQVIRQHATEGIIYLKIDNGYEISELHDVYINSGTLANNDVLQYDLANTRWTNKSLSGAGIIGGSGTTPKIPYWTAASTLGNSVITNDAVNLRAGVNVTPSFGLHVQSSEVQAAASIERVTFDTNAPRPALNVQLNSTGDMADGFGPIINFSIRDTANVDNPIGALIGQRAGADNTGKWIIGAYSAGSLVYRGIFGVPGVLLGTALALADVASAPVHVNYKNNGVTVSAPTAMIVEASTSGTPAGGFGLSIDTYLKSSTTASQLAAKSTVEWTDATHATRTALARQSTTGNATTIGYTGQWQHDAIADTAITIIRNATGDVTSIITIMYAVQDNTTAANNAGGIVTLTPGGGAVSICSDETDTLDITCAANGRVIIARSEGTHTFKAVLQMVWM